MGAAWSNFWVKHDPDDLFAYKTPKIVKIRDKRLGLMHYGFQFAVFIYLIGIVLFLNNGFLKREPPVGSIRFTLREPSTFKHAEDAVYCKQNPKSTMNPLNCVYWDHNDVMASMSSDGFCITTRVKEQQQARTCNVFQYGCKYNDTHPTESYYAMEVEDFTALVDHNVRARTLPVNATMKGMVGRLKSHTTGKILMECAPGTKCRPPGVEADIIPIGMFINATQYQLDEPSCSNPPPSTNRYDGLVIVVEIEYSNEESGYNWSNVTYTYEVNAIPGAEFKVEEVEYNEFPGKRTLLDRHGVRIVFLRSGFLGFPDFQTALIQLVTGTALLSAATFAVDFLALSVMPEKKHYTEIKYQVSADFSDVRDGITLIEEESKSYGTLQDQKHRLMQKYGSSGAINLT